MLYEAETDAALSIARGAGRIALKYFESETVTEEKSDLSPVTVADRECERYIAAELASRFPEDGLLGEEGASASSRSGRRWLIDPVDGTRDFVRRLPFWAVQIALQDAGEIVTGVIYVPVLDEMYHATLGAGAFLNDTRLRASEVASVDKAILMVSGFSAVWNTWPEQAVRRLTQTCWTVRAYSGCYDVAILARGKADIWLSGSGMEWDYAPARIIARETGAAFLCRDGSDRIDLRHCVICSPGLETQMRRTLRITG